MLALAIDALIQALLSTLGAVGRVVGAVVLDVLVAVTTHRLANRHARRLRRRIRGLVRAGDLDAVEALYRDLGMAPEARTGRLDAIEGLVKGDPLAPATERVLRDALRFPADPWVTLVALEHVRRHRLAALVDDVRALRGDDRRRVASFAGTATDALGAG